jgi:simple sugar transport system substrate-binding protein
MHSANGRMGQVRATAAVDATLIGEVSLRVLALNVAGVKTEHVVEMKPVLITSDYLIENNINTLEELKAKMPELATSDLATAPWLKAPAQ